MPRRKRSLSPCDFFDDDYDDDSNSQSSRNGHPPIQRNAANARERARMRVLSSAFGRLKKKLPNIPPDTKLSKLDTLRLATLYIKQLRALAEGTNSSNDETMNQMQFTDHNNLFGTQSLTWPFGLHHIQHATNRQLPFQCSTMEWSSAHDPADTVKNMRLTEESLYQNHSHAQPIQTWYTTQDTDSATQRNSCNSFDVFNGFNQVPHSQSQHLTGSHSSSSTHNHHHHHHHHHHQSTMPPIR